MPLPPPTTPKAILERAGAAIKAEILSHPRIRLAGLHEQTAAAIAEIAVHALFTRLGHLETGVEVPMAFLKANWDDEPAIMREASENAAIGIAQTALEQGLMVTGHMDDQDTPIGPVRRYRTLAFILHPNGDKPGLKYHEPTRDDPSTKEA